MRRLEVCCGNLASVWAAIEGGAARVELCRDLELDGLTPCREIIREAVSLCRPAGVRVHTLIRSRVGNFVYTNAEVAQMADQISIALEEGTDGVVIGALTSAGDVDLDACRRWMNICRDDGDSLRCNVTFHRAFDVCRNPFVALEQIHQLGCNRILTSGQQPTAEMGIPLLCQLVERARILTERTGHELTILCGAGVNTLNALPVLNATGAMEIHGSLRTGLVSDVSKIRKITSLLT